MKLQNRDVLVLFETIKAVDSLVVKSPAKVTYANNKNMAALIDSYNAVNKVRAKLIEECGIKDDKSPVGFKVEEDKKTLVFKDEKARDKWEKELGPILSEEVEVDLYMISIDYFDGVDIDKKEIPSIGIYFKYLVTD